jgi:multidrug efflux pump subunit AcrA (membrane-fusion protein)
MILFSLGYVASKLFSGWGLLLTIVAAIGWMYQPVAGFIAKIPQYRMGNPSFASHLAIRLILVGGLASLLLFGISWKKNITIPAVILFEKQYSIRAESSGFIKEVLVRSGASVQKGETLILLENAALENRAKGMEFEKQILEIEERQAHVQRQYADLQILNERQNVLAAQYTNVEKDREALVIRAPGSGVVVGKELQSRIGTFVSKGQELLLIVKAVNKQLLASVSQDDAEIFLGKVGNPVLVDMRASGLGKFTAVIEKVAPTASRKLLHFSLAATYGGPFDVRPGTGLEQELVLFSPRFTVTVQLPEKVKQTLRSGQQALVVISACSRTPGSILWEVIQDWFSGRQQS